MGYVMKREQTKAKERILEDWRAILADPYCAARHDPQHVPVPQARRCDTFAAVM